MTTVNGFSNPCVEGTPVEQYSENLWVKREDLSCPGGPNFSKMRGVFRHVAKQNASAIGVLDTFHSQAGHAVARAGALLGKKVFNFYPVFKNDGPTLRDPQKRAEELGAQLVGLPAGMSAVLWHQANRYMAEFNGFLMPNGLQLGESIDETRLEVLRTDLPERLRAVIIAASSGTIAQGVVEGFLERPEYLYEDLPTFYIHMGYSRSHTKMYARFPTEDAEVILIDEHYAYKDKARPGKTPTFPCNPYYDLKAWRWYHNTLPGERLHNLKTLFWNIG